MHWRELTLDACLYVCRRMRETDRRECFCLRHERSDDPGAIDDFALSRWRSAGPKWAVWDEDKPLIIGGVDVENPVTGSIWLVATDEYRRGMLTAIRNITKFVIPKAHEAGLHRIQALVWTENGTAVRFIEFLGLEREGELRKLGRNGESFYQYARVT